MIVIQPEPLKHGFESAVFPLMSKLGGEHIEGNGSFNSFAICNKIEARVFIDELPDQPRGSKSIDMEIASCYPAAPLILRDIESGVLALRDSNPGGWSLRGPDCRDATLISIECDAPTLGVKKVVVDDSLQFGMKLIEFALVYCQTAGREVFATRLLPNRTR